MLDSIKIKFATPVKQHLLALEMEKATIEKKKLQKKLAAQQIIDNSEINSINSRIVMQKSQMQVFENQIKSLTMTAPCDGVVIHCESPVINIMGNGVGTLGGKIEEKSSVWSNMPLLQFPDMKEMQVSVDVPESDYKRILEGQKTFITVEAATNLHTTGKIKRKSLAGKSISENSKVKTYEIIISIDSCHDKIKPGLSAAAQIIVDDVKDTIIVPASAIFTHDSTKIVYVADNGKFIQNTVETGLANSSSVIISKGLKGNETIALTEPPHFMIRKTAKTFNSDTIKSSDGMSNKLTNDTSGKNMKSDNK
jgi:multidrug efflux pump subunit AcrA (membrane-fusion protein)